LKVKGLISWLHPYSTSKVVLNMYTQYSWTTTGPHPNWAGCHPPQRTRRPRQSNSPTLGKCPGTFPLGARPHVQCRRHMPCRVSLPGHTRAICPHTDPYAQPRGSALMPFVTPRPQRRTTQPFRGASPLTHSTSLTLSSSLRVKGSTRRCYGWRTKAYKLAPPLLN